MPVFLTLLIGKIILRTSRMLHRGGGSALPGLIAERLDPDIATKLARNLKHGCVLVTGTNGKTTTTKMLNAILVEAGETVVNNRAGSNLNRGIISALIEEMPLWGRSRATLGLFEVDEAAMPAVAAALQPRVIVVLNLFRDQLDRYGELDKTASLIGAGIAATQAKIYLNADDPLVASLGKYASDSSHVAFFGVDKPGMTRMAGDMAADSDHCPVCGRALEYQHIFFGHIGKYRCPEGHFDRPKPAFSLLSIRAQSQNESMLEVKTPEGKVSVHLLLPGLYNAYNALGAIAVADALGVNMTQTIRALSKTKAAFGRVEKLRVEGKNVYLLLIKNPTGFNQIIQTFLRDLESPTILMAINDNPADGRDVSWLWDVAIDELVRSMPHVVASGVRATDMALRLKYTGIVSEVEESLTIAFERALTATPKGGTLYVLPTYTAMLSLRSVIGKKVKITEEWKA